MKWSFAHTSILLAVGLGALASRCTCQDSNQARLMPRPPPPPAAVIPRDLAIPVEIEGRPAAPITAAILESQAPSYVDAEHRAWSIATLLGPEVTSHDVSITVVGENDLAIKMPRPKADRELEPVLMLSRRGELTIALVSPDDPFPPYHGQGRRLARGGDPLPRVSGKVVKIAVANEPEPAAPRSSE